MTISDPISDEDRKHIQRLQVLRQTGIVNMVTELRQGLDAMLTEEEAEETWTWVQENAEYYMSGDWTAVSVPFDPDEPGEVDR